MELSFNEKIHQAFQPFEKVFDLEKEYINKTVERGHDW